MPSATGLRMPHLIAAVAIASVLLGACGGTPTVEEYAAVVCRPAGDVAPGESPFYADKRLHTANLPPVLEGFHDRLARGDSEEELKANLPLAAVPGLVAAGCELRLLIVIADGTTDALTLEWNGWSAAATSWQYRYHMWDKGSIVRGVDWMDIAGSNGSTNQHRLTGLEENMGYEVWVRPMVGTEPGPPSNPGRGVTSRALHRDRLVEGDGRTWWSIHGNWTVIIPEGARLRGGPVWIDGGCFPTGGSVREATSGSVVSYCFDGRLSCELGRSIAPGVDDERAVNALFDRISPGRSCLDLSWGWEDESNGGGELALAAVGIVAIGLFVVAVRWALRSSG
ncbi:MAG: fibronectin type III domain-containing protein [Dehalococcoidia bacterium]|nr:fibronectin type III domain-containing protein [Dehalococcoidia bacterium]MYA53269.1 fibronectin type III domain-containing protein [Dehalococcoidia bacterium]